MLANGSSLLGSLFLLDVDVLWISPLDKLHRDHAPMQASTWVDDIAQTVIGPPQFAVPLAAKAGAA